MPTPHRPHLLSQLLDSPNLSKDILGCTILSFMLAGRDTTRTLLAWTLFFLSQHPEVEAKVVEEMLTTLSKGPGQGLAAPDFESVKSMHYLMATLTEVRVG